LPLTRLKGCYRVNVVQSIIASHKLIGPMSYNARNDEIRDNRFNATLSAKGYVWFWSKIAAALTSKHHWLIIACDSCGTVVDLDLSVKPRDPEASIRVALAMSNVRAAMDMAGRASLLWRDIRRFEIV
jgi:hypothetical protein